MVGLKLFELRRTWGARDASRTNGDRVSARHSTTRIDIRKRRGLRRDLACWKSAPRGGMLKVSQKRSTVLWWPPRTNGARRLELALLLLHDVFFGELQSRQSIDGITLAHRIAASPPEEVQVHTHLEAHFVLITSGRYVSSAKATPHRETTLIYNPPGTTHRDHFQEGRGSFLHDLYLTQAASRYNRYRATAGGHLPRRSPVLWAGKGAINGMCAVGCVLGAQG